MDPMRSCPQYSGPSAQVVLTATPGVRSARISWWNYGDPDVQYFRVAAIPRVRFGSLNPTWRNLTVPKGCLTVSSVITGLTSGQRYEFMLEAVETNHLGRNPALHRGIGHSDLITIR
jgi:hypothetical protein